MFLQNQNLIGNPSDLTDFYDPFSDGRYQDKIINEGDIELHKQILCTIIA